ncbi:hypothetical protein RchiOBHm_Chr2g0084341 [Rosa chinensis]|uniref:Uncharacterized protein n=1 Tax=Rosa chinensis TaxID=74649 RepID=A0A2P6RHU1_ROSCH|nr:hypothetical protein RchiOBHm_Chr2g0084341 [Rosa chinensis]
MSVILSLSISLTRLLYPYKCKNSVSLRRADHEPATSSTTKQAQPRKHKK